MEELALSISLPPEIPSGCPGSGTNWVATIILNLPKIIFFAGLLLVFVAHKKKWTEWIVWTIYILTVLAGVAALVVPYLLFGTWRLGRQWFWLNVPLYGCM